MITKELGFFKSKTSLLLNDMENKGLVRRKKNEQRSCCNSSVKRRYLVLNHVSKVKHFKNRRLID